MQKKNNLFEAYNQLAVTPSQDRSIEADNMALRKADLVDTLQQFKNELRAEIKMDLSKEIQDLQADLNGKLTTLHNDIDSPGLRILEPETSLQSRERQHKELRNNLQLLQEQVDIKILKTEDLENRSRRINIRIKGLRENAEDPDLHHCIQNFLESLQLEEHPEVRMDRVHRVGRQPMRDSPGQRDILEKINDFQIKELILQEACK